jgi:hypothetical protein
MNDQDLLNFAERLSQERESEARFGRNHPGT